jgi:malonate decarboxylase alpha subunit
MCEADQRVGALGRGQAFEVGGSELGDDLVRVDAPSRDYGDDVTHIISEEGIANLLLCRTAEEREQAIRGIAGFTDVGRARDHKMV